MSEILEQFNFRQQGTRSKYDWDALLDGRIHKISRDEYGASSPLSFRTIIYNNAAKRGLTVQTAVLEDESVVFQVTGSRERDDVPVGTLPTVADLVGAHG